MRQGFEEEYAKFSEYVDNTAIGSSILTLTDDMCNENMTTKDILPKLIKLKINDFLVIVQSELDEINNANTEDKLEHYTKIYDACIAFKNAIYQQYRIDNDFFNFPDGVLFKCGMMEYEEFRTSPEIENVKRDNICREYVRHIHSDFITIIKFYEDYAESTDILTIIGTACKFETTIIKGDDYTKLLYKTYVSGYEWGEREIRSNYKDEVDTLVFPIKELGDKILSEITKIKDTTNSNIENDDENKKEKPNLTVAQRAYAIEMLLNRLNMKIGVNIDKTQIVRFIHYVIGGAKVNDVKNTGTYKKIGNVSLKDTEIVNKLFTELGIK